MCERLARRHYENFSVLSRLVPKPFRADFAAVYAFCRWADDLGDEAGSTERASALLAWWRAELERCFDGAPRHPVFIALHPVIERRGLVRTPFEDLIAAFEMDQRRSRYETWDQLLEYCRLSANPVGRLVLAVLGEEVGAEGLAQSDDICTALQLTNHWQDMRRDLLERDRIYVPSELIRIEDFERRFRASAAQGYAVDRTFLGESRQLVRDLLERTWTLYERGEKLLGRLSPTARPIVWLLGAGGQRVAHLIEQWNFETVLHRPRLGKATKALLVARAMLFERSGAKTSAEAAA